MITINQAVQNFKIHPNISTFRKDIIGNELEPGDIIATGFVQRYTWISVSSVQLKYLIGFTKDRKLPRYVPFRVDLLRLSSEEDLTDIKSDVESRLKKWKGMWCLQCLKVDERNMTQKYKNLKLIYDKYYKFK